MDGIDAKLAQICVGGATWRFRSMRSTDDWHPCGPVETNLPERQEREHLGVKFLRYHPRDRVFLGGVPLAYARPEAVKVAVKLFARYSDLIELSLVSGKVLYVKP